MSSVQRLLRYPWFPAAFIFAVALALRGVVALWMPAQVVWGDGERYLLVALNLLEGRGFGGVLENRLSVPMQPLLIAAVFAVFGKSFHALRLFFALVGAATCVLGYLLAKKLFDSTTALLAGLLLALYPPLVYLSALFEYPQAFFIFVMALFFVLLLDFFNSERKRTLFLSGLCLGIAIVTSPTVMLYVPLLLIGLWSNRFSTLVVRCLVLLVAVSIPVGSWTARNYAAYGQLMLVNQSSGMNFYVANNETYYEFGKEAVIPACGEGYKQTAYCKDFQYIGRKLGAEFSAGQIDEKQLVAAEEKYSWDQGLAFVRESPTRFLILAVKKFLHYWSPNPDAVHKGGAFGGTLREWGAFFSYVPVLILGILGVVLSVHRWRSLVPIYAYFLTFMAAYSIFLPTTRYRLPLDFFLVIFCAYSLNQLARRYFSGRFIHPSATLQHEPTS